MSATYVLVVASLNAMIHALTTVASLTLNLGVTRIKHKEHSKLLNPQLGYPSEAGSKPLTNH
jgi:hypothetical protein